MIYAVPYNFEKGDVLFVRLPENSEVTIKIVAVPKIKDSDVCYGCILYNLCRKYPGNSPFAWRCYDTIFKKEQEGN